MMLTLRTDSITAIFCERNKDHFCIFIPKTQIKEYFSALSVLHYIFGSKIFIFCKDKL